MGCSERMMLLASLYIDDALEDDEKEEFDKHLAGCEICRSQLEELKDILQRLKDMPQPELPMGLHSHVLQRVENAATPIDFIAAYSSKKKSRRPKKQKSYSAAPLKRFLAAAAGVFAVLLTFGTAVNFLSTANVTTPRFYEAGVQPADGETAMDSAGEVLEIAGRVMDSAGEVLEGAGRVLEGAGEVTMAGTVMLAEDTVVLDEMAAAIPSNTDYIIREFSVSLETDNLEDALWHINQLPGHNDYANVQYSGYASITRRVSNQDYDKAKTMLRRLGGVVSEREEERNISHEAASNAASLHAKEIEMERLTNLLKNSRSIEAMTAIESRLRLVEEQKDAFTSQSMALRNSAAYPCLYIEISSNSTSLHTEPPLTPREKIITAFLGSVHTCRAAAEWIIVAASAFVPPAAVIGGAFIICFSLVKKTRKGSASGK